MNEHLDLSAGPIKRIFIDPKLLRSGQHAWTIQTEEGRVVAAALEAGIWRGVYSSAPLFTDGPNCWLETERKWTPPADAEVFAWPVPIRGKGADRIPLGDGVIKRVHVDRHRLRQSAPSWTVRTIDGIVRASHFDLDDGLVGVQSRNPLFHGGPRAWLEATCEIIVHPKDRIHQAVFPKRLSPTEVPTGAPRR